MPAAAITVALPPFQNAIDFPLFPYDGDAKCRMQEHVVGPRMCRSAPVYTPQKPDSRCGEKGFFFVKMEVHGVGIWYGRGSSKKIAESSAAISGLIDLGIDSIQQHSGQPASETAKVAPVPLESVRQYPYDDQAKCRLQELVVGRTMRLPAPKYTVRSVTGPRNDPFFIVKMEVQKIGTWLGSGPNKKHAECSAAVAALIDLRFDEPERNARKSDSNCNFASVREAL
jgi:dsRNA-specific ribonuclease